MRFSYILAVSTLGFMACTKTEKTTVVIKSDSVQQHVLTDNQNEIIQETKPTTTMESSDNGGSSLTGNVSNLNIKINLSADQLFDFDKAVLKPEADAELQKAFDDINGKTEATVLVVGHTDAKGSDNYNKRLSDQRANAVKKWLENKGLKNQILTEGKGAKDPIAPNTNPDGSDNPEGRAKNRRVEIKVSTQQSL